MICSWSFFEKLRKRNSAYELMKTNSIMFYEVNHKLLLAGIFALIFSYFNVFTDQIERLASFIHQALRLTQQLFAYVVPLNHNSKRFSTFPALSLHHFIFLQFAKH